MTEEEAKNAKHQQYVEDEKKRRSRIMEGLKKAGIAVIMIGAYLIGRKVGKSPNEKA